MAFPCVRFILELLFIFFFNDTATTEIYTTTDTLSLHDALPISAYSSSYRPVSSSRPRYSPILRIAPLMLLPSGSGGRLAPGRVLWFWTLLVRGPRTEDRRANAHVCRAGPDRVLEVRAHPGRQPGRGGVVDEERRADLGQPGERRGGVLPERGHRHQPAQLEHPGLVDRGRQVGQVAEVGTG